MHSFGAELRQLELIDYVQEDNATRLYHANYNIKANVRNPDT